MNLGWEKDICVTIGQMRFGKERENIIFLGYLLHDSLK
jgi:hypothetical protein